MAIEHILIIQFSSTKLTEHNISRSRNTCCHWATGCCSLQGEASSASAVWLWAASAVWPVAGVVRVGGGVVGGGGAASVVWLWPASAVWPVAGVVRTVRVDGIGGVVVGGGGGENGGARSRGRSERGSAARRQGRGRDSRGVD